MTSWTCWPNAIVKLFNDEGVVRAAAQAALDAAPETGAWQQVVRRHFQTTARFKDFAEFELRMMRPTYADHRIDDAKRDAARTALHSTWAPTAHTSRDPGTAIVPQYAVLPYFTLVRFGQWQTLLRGTVPPDTNAPYPLAIWHCARGTVLARTGEADAAARADREAKTALRGAERLPVSSRF